MAQDSSSPVLIPKPGDYADAVISSFPNLRDNLLRARMTIADAAEKSGRSLDSITLVAVSKTVDVSRLEHTLILGQRVFGENRVQEAKHKWPALKQMYPGLELHLLGPLQTNKVRDAVALFDVIQSVDRIAVAEAIAKERDRQGRNPQIYIQINTSCEPQKSGATPEDLTNLLQTCRERYDLTVTGLMCIPPAIGNPGNDFALLAKIARDHALAILSMGMSGDYAEAIKHGATHVRIGSAIFGARPALRT